MIKSELIKDPCDLYIKHSVTIDLDTLEVIHQKLTNACYTEIEYRFSARRTNYTCNMVNEIRTIFSQEGISEISNLDMIRKSSSNATFCQFLIGLLYFPTARRMEKPYNQFCLHSYNIFPFCFRIFFSTKNANSFQKRRALHPEVVSHI